MAGSTQVMPRPQPPAPGLARREQDYHVNVGNLERLGSLVGGGALMLYGLRRSLGSIALLLGGGALLYRGLSGHCAVYETLDVSTAKDPTSPGVLLEATVTIHKPVEEVYRFWRQVENHPRFLQHLEAARSIENGRSRWSARGPLQRPLSWEVEQIEDRPNSLLAWRSLPGAAVDFLGTVRLRELPDQRGTEVRLRLEYAPPGGVVGVALGKLLKTLRLSQLHEDLRRLKQIMEAGETPVSV
ncbi:MAG: SRPBCC family protein [Candidatus Tectimicrobiota bacterium]